MNDWSVVSNYYDRIAHLYDATRPLPVSVSEQISNCILSLANATPNTKFLEPGIGTGRTAFPIVQKGYSYTGIDISAQMMDELRRKFPQTPHNLTLIQGDASTLPFKDSSFDVVLTTHVLQCLNDPVAGLSEIRRVLKANGIYLACENLMAFYHREFEQPLRKIIARYQAELSPSFQPSKDTKPFVFGEGMKQLLSELGATVEVVSAARWQQSHTVGELFDMYQSRAVALCWLIPDALFSQAIQEFKTLCQQQYPSFDIVLSDEVIFNIIVARNWAVTEEE
jgi:ubiquinone/menaquinone biosynthesis C-methylase UbiE